MIELLEGETLAERRGPVPVASVLTTRSQLVPVEASVLVTAPAPA